jgi:hypothetical protein
MWGGCEDSFDSHHKGMLDTFNSKSNEEYCDLPYVHAGGNERVAGAFIKDYHLWLARQLPSNGRVSIDEVQDEINKLLKKYSL